MAVARLDRKLAEAALAAIREQFREYVEPCDLGDGLVVPAGAGPVLREDWDGDGNWAIVWEEGPDQWPLCAFEGGVDPEVFELALPEVRAALPRVSDAEARRRARRIVTNRAAECPRGVHAKAHYSFVLLLYPAA